MNIVLGVSGSIAACKIPELVSALTKKGDKLSCLLTKNASYFVTPLTLQTLSRNRVFTGIEDESEEWKPPHIEWADKADLFVVAPASADIIAKFACGIADDTLTSCYLVNRSPVLIVPAMNGKMWEHKAVKKNVEILKERKCSILGPEKEGMLACGYEGTGRMISVEKILSEIDKYR